MELTYTPWLKLFVAILRSEKVKFFQEDLKQQRSASPFSLILLLFLLDIIFGTARGGKEGNRFMELFFHSLKNTRQRESECGFEEEVLRSETWVLGESAPVSKPLMHASKTPLGEELSSFSFSISKHLRSKIGKSDKGKSTTQR